MYNQEDNILLFFNCEYRWMVREAFMIQMGSALQQVMVEWQELCWTFALEILSKPWSHSINVHHVGASIGLHLPSLCDTWGERYKRFKEN